jgi:hypothetical protein
MFLRFVMLGSMLALVLLAGTARAENRIEQVTIASEGAAEVVLDVVYSYDGDHGGKVAISAVMANDGKTSAHYAHRPGRVERGRHRTRVTLATNRSAPASFATNQIEVAMYEGGGEAFVSRQFSFAKTWSQPGASLPPVLHLARLQARPALAQVPQLEVVPPAQPGSVDQAGAVTRKILPDGSVELHYPDGTIRHRFAGGETVTRPDGTTSTMLFQNAQPPTPPTAPPDASHANWLEAENARLLDIMRTLVGNDEASIQHYLEREGSGHTVYEQIEGRTGAVAWLVNP